MSLHTLTQYPSLHMTPESVETLKEIAESTGESPENYLLGSIGLISILGIMIEATDSAPNFMLGIIDPENNSYTQIDIASLLEETINVPSTKTELTPIETYRAKCVQIPLEHMASINVATNYYNTSITNLARIAISVRWEILHMLDEGYIYGFSADGEHWHPIELTRVELNPNHN